MKLIEYFKSPQIEFYCDERYWGVAPPPVPAGKYLPEWFKHIPARSDRTRDGKGKFMMNAKKCLPMLDAMQVGFIIPMPIDQHLRVNHDCSQIVLSPTSTLFGKAAEFHDTEQVGGVSELFRSKPIKFINPWVVKTPPGWSTLFIPPINHFDPRFICLGGLVDTDTYRKQINFPARWLQPNYDGTIESGTPLVVAIPIKRQTLKHTTRLITKGELEEIDLIHRQQQARDHVYTKELREKR